MMFAAARLVRFLRAHHNDWIIVMSGFPVDQTLGAAGRLPADQADCMQFGDFLGLAHKLRHRPEWLCTEIGIQPRQNHPYAVLGKLIDNIDQFSPEELGLIYGNDSRIWIQAIDNILCCIHCMGLDIAPVMAADMLGAVTIVNDGLKYLGLLPGNHGPANPADQLFRLATEHAATDNFYPPTMMLHRNPLKLMPVQVY